MLTAWSAGGIVGPILITSFGTTTNPDYATPLYIIAGIMLVSTALPLAAHALGRRRGAVVGVALHEQPMDEDVVRSRYRRSESRDTKVS
jgi:hypothetical protein